jgi:transcriptional regulator with XRE-family HTH domain
MFAMKGVKLRERRLALGLSQQGLADKLEVSRNTVARWEREEMANPGFLR